MAKRAITSSGDRRFDQLARRASARFCWQWQSVMVAGQHTNMAVATDPDAMLIEACERQDAGEQGVIDPFWATTWRAATGLDLFLDRYDLKNQRVLEVGCGTGHAGLSAALRGANVVMTDGVSDPLLLARMSCWKFRDRCEIRRLRFGLDQLPSPAFPIILGSDVTYLRSLWPQLDECLRSHIASDGQVLLSDPYRIIANEFREWIIQKRWEYMEHQVTLDDDPEHPIRVMVLRRK